MTTTGGGRSPSEDLLEVPAGEGVLALEEEGPGEFQPHPHQLRTVYEHGAEGGDGLVQQRVARVLGNLGLLRRAGGREADVEEHVPMDGTSGR